MTKKLNYVSPECEMVMLSGDRSCCLLPGSADPVLFEGFEPEVDWDA